MILNINSIIKLNNGVEMPRIGLGVYLTGHGQECHQAIQHAVDTRYRHIDTAMFYHNEKDVGFAVRNCGIAREQIFVTTKLWNSDHGYDSTLAAFEDSCTRLGLDYIDLYLIHWPVQGLRLESWRAMEMLLEAGKCRAIGVSNYMVHHLTELFDNCRIRPAVNQIEMSPYIYQHRREVVDYCKSNNIVIEAYSPLTKGTKLRDPRLVKVAEKYGKTPAQILIRWCLQHDFVVIPKSVKKQRIEENANVFDFTISPKAMADLDSFDEKLTTSWDPTNAP